MLCVGWVAALTACADTSRETTLVVRTSLPEELRDYVEDTFEAANPDVDVRFSEVRPEESLAELQAGAGAPFDVWWGPPAQILERAAAAGLLQPYQPPWLRQPGVGQPDREARWQVILVSPFVIAFNHEEVPLARAPTDWADLFHFRWADELYLLDPTSVDEAAYFMGAMLVEALRDDDDLLSGFDWHRRLDVQAKRYVRESRDIIRALETGDALLTILPRYIVEKARNGDAPWIYYRLPESGTPMLALGVAITARTEVGEVARRFVDHLGTMDVTTASKLYTHWQPGHGDVDMSRFPDGFEIDQRWSPYPLAIDTLVAELDGWVDRWDLKVRDKGDR
jgi:iron(III) transport system substrate-binding protein